MKYLCEGCERLVEVGRYRVEAAALELLCPRCGAGSRVEGGERPGPVSEGERPVVVPFAPRPSSPAPAPTVEPAATAPVVPAAERCPKCATPKREATACPKCGLIFALYHPEADVIPQSARREFARLLEEWGSPASARLLEAVGPDQVALLARLARHHLADFPGDARAQGILDALTGRSMLLATAAAQSQRLASNGAGLPLALLVAVGLLVLVGAAVGILSLLRHG